MQPATSGAIIPAASAVGVPNMTNKLDVGGNLVPISGNLGGYQPTNTLNASQAGTTSPYSVPTVAPNTTAAGINGAADALVGQTQAKVAQDQANVDKGQSDLTDINNRIVGIQNSQGQMEQDAGLDQKLQATTNAANALDVSRQAQNNEISALDKQLLTPQEKIAATNEINHRYALDQANQSVILSAANRDYSTAAAIIQHKIDLQLAPLQTRKDFLTSFYNDNKDLLSKDEQNQFSALSTQAQQAYDTAKTQLTQIGDIQKTAMTNGAPSDVLAAIGSAKTPAEAITASAGYGQDPLDAQIKRAQLTKLNADAAKAVKELGDATSKNGTEAMAQAKGNIELIGGLATNKYLGTAVGPNTIARTSLSNFFTGGKTNFLAGVQQLTSQLSLDSLIQAKAKGATFGALSEGELKVLAASASKLDSWAVKDAKGNVTGYNANEADFKAELDKINNFAKLDYIVRGGTPDEVGAQKQPDGTYWVQNSDGTFTQLQ